MKSRDLSELARYSGYLQPLFPQQPPPTTLSLPSAPSWPSSHARNRRNVSSLRVSSILHAHPPQSLTAFSNSRNKACRLGGSRAHAKYIYTDRWKYQKDRRRKQPGAGGGEERTKRKRARPDYLTFFASDWRENIRILYLNRDMYIYIYMYNYIIFVYRDMVDNFYSTYCKNELSSFFIFSAIYNFDHFHIGTHYLHRTKKALIRELSLCRTSLCLVLFSIFFISFLSDFCFVLLFIIQ